MCICYPNHQAKLENEEYSEKEENTENTENAEVEENAEKNEKLHFYEQNLTDGNLLTLINETEIKEKDNNVNTENENDNGDKDEAAEGKRTTKHLNNSWI